MKIQRLQERIAVALVLDNIYKEDDIVDIWQFDQSWPSTALGFNACGGDMITSALTSVILRVDGKVDVYFSTKKAYTMKMSPALMEDIRRFRMEPVMNAHKYNTADGVSTPTSAQSK